MLRNMIGPVFNTIACFIFLCRILFLQGERDFQKQKNKTPKIGPVFVHKKGLSWTSFWTVSLSLYIYIYIYIYTYIQILLLWCYYLAKLGHFRGQVCSSLFFNTIKMGVAQLVLKKELRAIISRVIIWVPSWSFSCRNKFGPNNDPCLAQNNDPLEWYWFGFFVFKHVLNYI